MGMKGNRGRKEEYLRNRRAWEKGKKRKDQKRKWREKGAPIWDDVHIWSENWSTWYTAREKLRFL